MQSRRANPSAADYRPVDRSERRPSRLNVQATQIVKRHPSRRSGANPALVAVAGFVRRELEHAVTRQDARRCCPGSSR